jgi:hypothetical protein
VQILKRLGELDNIQLLYDVKADALQPIDELVDDSQIGTLVDFSTTVRQESVEKLEREIRNYPMDIPLFADVVNGVKQIRAGVKEEKLLEILIADYWEKNLKGKAAFDKYLTIIAVMKICEEASTRELQQILMYELLELNDISGVSREW